MEKQPAEISAGCFSDDTIFKINKIVKRKVI